MDNKDLVQAIDKLVSLYDVFNIEYPHKLKYFFQILQMEIYIIDEIHEDGL